MSKLTEKVIVIIFHSCLIFSRVEYSTSMMTKQMQMGKTWCCNIMKVKQTQEVKEEEKKSFAFNQVCWSHHFSRWHLRLQRETVTPKAFTSVVSLVKAALWEKFPILSAPLFAFMPSEPTLLTFWRRTNEIHRRVRCCRLLWQQQTMNNKLIKPMTAGWEGAFSPADT